MRHKMTGNEYSLNVYLGNQHIANLSLEDDLLHWHYTKKWQQSGYAISPHLPLNYSIATINVQRFLRNLLPEGNGLDVLLKTFHLSKSNTFGLIRALGLDMSGALIVLPPQHTLPQIAHFRPITQNELQQRLETGSELHLIVWDGKPRLSVAGIQEKINVLMNEENQLGFGEGTLCSTHILKFEKFKQSHLVLNEYITMTLAKHCGLPVASVALHHYGKHNALIIERFDRKLTSTSVVKRRHVIDGCQALNLAPEYKYERVFGSGRDVAHIRDGASLVKLFDFSNYCINPAITKQQLLDWLLFNLLVYNFDAHGKNLSFFVGINGISLAPFYDLVNINMYPEFSQEMAMGLGDEFDGNDINAYQLADFADTCQLSRRFVSMRLTQLIKKIQHRLNELIVNTNSSSDEYEFLTRYCDMVQKRCNHMMDQSQDIVSIKL
jgi:serine/threonine-protein kinase HipA